MYTYSREIGVDKVTFSLYIFMKIKLLLKKIKSGLPLRMDSSVTAVVLHYSFTRRAAVMMFLSSYGVDEGKVIPCLSCTSHVSFEVPLLVKGSLNWSPDLFNFYLFAVTVDKYHLSGRQLYSSKHVHDLDKSFIK